MWEKNLQKVGYIYMYNWLTWNPYNIVNQLYSNKIKK